MEYFHHLEKVKISEEQTQYFTGFPEKVAHSIKVLHLCFDAFNEFSAIEAENQPFTNFSNLKSLILEFQDFEIEELENSELKMNFQMMENLRYLEILTLEEDQDFNFHMLKI